MGFLDSRSHSLPRPWRVGLSGPLGVSFFVAYLLNLVGGPEPDGAAYLSMAQQGHWLHAQHLLAGGPLRALLVAFPEHSPERLSGVLSALSGGLAVTAACGLGSAVGLGRYGAPLAAALIRLSQGWWVHGTADAALGQLDTGRPFSALAQELLLGELRQGADRPANTEVAMRARHALAYALARLPEKSPRARALDLGVQPGPVAVGRRGLDPSLAAGTRASESAGSLARSPAGCPRPWACRSWLWAPGTWGRGRKM